MGTLLSWVFYLTFQYFYYGFGVVAMMYYTDDNHKLDVDEAEQMLLMWPVAAWGLANKFPADFAKFVVNFKERRSLPSSAKENDSES
jgi:hypothetical protein